MRILKFITFAALASLAMAGGIAAALRLTRPHLQAGAPLYTPVVVSIAAVPAHRSQESGNSSDLSRGSIAQANVLQLPKASSDFVGFWGGYLHSSIQRLSPELTGNSPDRVSVIFGRRGGTIFMFSKLYSSPQQRIVHHPTARMLSPRVASVEYESADKGFDYICKHTFRLKDTSSISYQATINIYDLNSHKLMGIVTETAALKRLLTAREQLRFARPGKNQIPRAQVSAREHYSPSH
jgi:hypothetical protein